MSGISDTHRGARIALDTARACAMQPDLFVDVVPLEFWLSIVDAANDQVSECDALRDAQREVACA